MHSIRTKILAIVLVFFAVDATAFVFYSIVTTRNYKHLRLEGIEKTAAFETERVNKEIAKMERGAIDLANNGLLHYSSQSEHAGEAFLLDFLRGFPSATGAGFWFEPYAYKSDVLRTGVYAYFDKTLGEARLDDIGENYDYHSQKWYREIIDNITGAYQTVWTKPYVDDSSYSLMTTAGVGIFDQHNRLIGVSIIDWGIERMIEDLTSVKPTENSFVLVCAPVHDYIISNTYTTDIVGASIKSLPWDLNAASFVLGDVSYLQFGRYMDNGWLLSVQIPESEIFAEVEEENNRFSLHIAISSIILLGIAYYLISKLINAPIKRLTSDVSQLALGNLDVSIKLSSKDELGMLAQTFNKMTADLKKSIEDTSRERTEKERISTELSVATEMQASMLPCIFPPFPERNEFDLYASMLPAKEVGGDFYDFFLIDEDTLGVIIADVSGKGVPAALFMVIAKTLIKNNACSGKSPKEVFDTVNSMLCENNEANMFVTAFMGYYTISSGRFVYVNAGHNPPLIKKSGCDYEFLRLKPNIVLAWMTNAQYKEEEIILEPDSVLYLYTDGITEAMNPNLDMFSETRLLTALNQNKDCPPKDLLHAVKREVDIFVDGAEQADDITMLALKVNTTKEGSTAQKIELEAVVENLGSVLDFVNAELERHSCPSVLQNDLCLVTEEIFMNIANYAYKPARGNAAIYVSAGSNDTITIKFEDFGKAHNPLEKTDPDLDKPPEARQIGGLGIYLVKKLMDKVEYKRVENKNILILTKNLQK